MPDPGLRDIARQALAPCAPERAFHFVTGHDARDLREFQTLLQKIDGGALEHHRHHYHYWLEGVCGDAPLARAVRTLGADPTLAGAALRDALTTTVAARVRELERAKRGAKPTARPKKASATPARATRRSPRTRASAAVKKAGARKKKR